MKNLKETLSKYQEILNAEEIELITGIIEYQDITDTDEQIEVIEAVENTDFSNDFYIEVGNMEFRIIDKEDIDQIWSESLEEQIKDCYDLDSIPSFIVIDWEQTVEDCKIDGMGHHFSSWDGSEDETENYHIFRTN